MKKHAHPDTALLSGIFERDGWSSYVRRSDILSAPHPENWSSIDFPVEIALELTNHCNLRCIMCPVPNLERERGFMEDGIFMKVVEQLSTESGFLFLPQGFGESLLHKKYGHFMDLAKRAGIRPIVVLTNGMLLDVKAISVLLNAADVLVVTVDGVTAKTYESVRVNGKFEKVKENIEQLLRLRDDAQSPHIVLRIIRMKETEDEVEAFRTYWADKLHSGDSVQVVGFNDWTGNVTYRGTDGTRTRRDRHPCRMLWKNLTVYHDGRVSPCCYDAEGELIVGSVLNQSLREIWKSSSLRDLRELHFLCQFEKIPICSRCGNWQ